MNKAILWGVVAGASGTIALDIATYADMALRGRPSSSTPAKLVGVLADKVGLPALGSGATDEKASNRRSGVGALLGYVTGLSVGTAYALAREEIDEVPTALAGIGLGLAAMAASDIPIAASGVSDPRTWAVADWAADLIPHLIYGLVTVAVYEALSRDAGGRQQM